MLEIRMRSLVTVKQKQRRFKLHKDRLPLVAEGGNKGRKTANEIGVRQDLRLGGVLQAVQLSV